MFTGIVAAKGTIHKVESRPGLSRLWVTLPSETSTKVALGASIAIDGVCLTVAQREQTASSADLHVAFDIMAETLRCTTLGALLQGDLVNVERSARFGDEIGGHLVSGHVDTVAEIVTIEQPENNYIVTFKIDPRWVKYVFPKGYVAINGTSLTIVDVDRGEGLFSIYFIPETLARTTIAYKARGDRVNIEIDRSTQTIVDTIQSYLSLRP